MGGTEFASADELANALGQQKGCVMSKVKYVAYLCQRCHDEIDGRKGRLSKEEKREKWLSAFVRTVSISFEEGIVK